MVVISWLCAYFFVRTLPFVSSKIFCKKRVSKEPADLLCPANALQIKPNIIQKHFCCSLLIAVVKRRTKISTWLPSW